MSYQHTPHPRIAERQPPAKTADHLNRSTGFARLNTWIAVKITAVVGTMICAYLFTALALISLPSALKSGQLIIIVAWIAQTFIQLVLLPIIIVGQNIQAKAADQRAEDTYKDAEAVLHEALEIQKHLIAQDAEIARLRKPPSTKPPSTKENVVAPGVVSRRKSARGKASE